MVFQSIDLLADILMILLITITSLFYLSLLFLEQIQINRSLQKLPLRITVSGTRGKSSTVRMIASILNQSGIRTFAKTTGSEPACIRPDGSVKKIRRRGITILEQKKILKFAIKNKAECIVTEIMSIQPENHRIESQKILKPHITLFTNFYPDHLENLEDNRMENWEVFSSDIYKKSKIFLHNSPGIERLIENAKEKDCCITLCNKLDAASIYPKIKSGPALYPENIDLIYELCKQLKIKEENIILGINKTVFDIGEFKIWELQSKNLIAVNAFGANDPKSTLITLSKTLKILETLKVPVNGFLNLRTDRPGRTLQWIDHFQKYKKPLFSRLFIHGGHTEVFKRKVPGAVIIRKGTVNQIIQQLHSDNDKSILFCFGNISGTGQKIINYFSKKGIEYDY
jgi:poly-gamma-glutamate synthase PgsB/CapB